MKPQFQMIFILGEDAANNVFLVAEVVIEIARAYSQMGRDMIGGDGAFAVFVEEFQTGWMILSRVFI